MSGTNNSPPPLGSVCFGSLRRLTPIDRDFGFNRGQPVDRVYIEEFLRRHAADIRGRVMEIDDSTYTHRFGGERVEGCEILHVDPNNARATVTADLSKADHLPSAMFDCLIVTQTLHLIYDVPAAIATLHRILKPGGVLLVTVPGISQISPDEWKESWYWSFTRCSLRRLFAEAFRNGDVQLEAYGNVLAATAFLYGLAAEELSGQELTYHDPQFEMLIAVRAVKPLDTR